MRLPPAIPPPVLTITMAGLVATVAQIIFLRELLVLFYGNELSAGLVFSGWLLWSALGSGLAGRWALKLPSTDSLLGLMLVALSTTLPLAVLFIRASRIIWALPAGELPSIGQMLLISGAVTGLFCPLTGALFGICWAIHRQQINSRPLGIYLGEALGSAVGGLAFYFLFLPYGSPFTAIWITAAMILLVSWRLLRPWPPASKLRWMHGLWVTVALLIAAGGISGSRLDQWSRRWQWGPSLLAVHDTAFHNVALLKKDGQLSVFTNGLWLFSEPDRLSAEYGAHLALLQHPAPKSVLLLGGGLAGLLDELFQQPGVSSVDYVEPDPDFVGLLRPYLSPSTVASVFDERVRLFHQDPRIFLRRLKARYDVILMNMGDPVTAQMNRFYTTEFFTVIKRRLSPGGIFSFAVSGGESMLGPTQARFLGSVKRTLLAVFPETLVYPGDQLRFFAAGRTGALIRDSSALAQRIADRHLDLTFIREEILQNALSPWRRDYLESILDSVTGTAINRDFTPICYFHNMMMWAIQWQQGLQNVFLELAAIPLRWLWSALAAGGAIIAAGFWTGRRKFRLAVAGSVFVSGAVEMVLQVVFLLGFQILAGFVYRQLALIIAFFMTGLAMGAGWMGRTHRSLPDTAAVRRQFLCVQALVCILPVGLILFFELMQHGMQSGLSPAAVGWLFSGISMITGVLGGMHFALAVAVTAATGAAVESIGGQLYALDLAGAAVGVLLAALFVVPVYGITNTLASLSILSAVSLLTLLRRP